MLTRDQMLAIYAEQAATDTASMLGRAVEIVAAQLETSRDVEPALRHVTTSRALEIAAKKYPDLVAAVLNANARIYAARIVATGTVRISNAAD